MWGLACSISWKERELASLLTRRLKPPTRRTLNWQILNPKIQTERDFSIQTNRRDSLSFLISTLLHISFDSVHRTLLRFLIILFSQSINQSLFSFFHCEVLFFLLHVMLLQSILFILLFSLLLLFAFLFLLLLFVFVLCIRA